QAGDHVCGNVLGAALAGVGERGELRGCCELRKGREAVSIHAGPAGPDGPVGWESFFFSSRRRHTRSKRDWSSDVCSSDLLFVPTDALPAALQHAKNYVLPAAETIHDDLYVGGSVVDIQGTVDGDLVVFGQTITVGGAVTGDVIAAGRDITISGSVGGTIRAAGSTVTIEGTVGHDVVAGCGTMVIGPHASVGRDVLGGSVIASFGGRISRDMRAGAGSATFSGSVGGNVEVASKEVRLTVGAVLERDLIYPSRQALEKSPRATVRGRIEQRMPRHAEERRGPFAHVGFVSGWVRGLVGFLCLGL